MSARDHLNERISPWALQHHHFHIRDLDAATLGSGEGIERGEAGGSSQEMSSGDRAHKTADHNRDLIAFRQRCYGPNIDHAPKSTRIKQPPSYHGPSHSSNVADIVQGVRVEDDEVRTLARC